MKVAWDSILKTFVFISIAAGIYLGMIYGLSFIVTCP